MGGFYRKPISATSAMHTLIENIDISDGATYGMGFAESGIAITLPKAGTYDLRFSICVSLSCASSFDNKWVEGQLYNYTDDEYVNGSHVYLMTATSLGPSGDLFIGQGTINCYLTVNSSKIIKLLISTHSINNPCFITANQTSYGYVLFS